MVVGDERGGRWAKSHCPLLYPTERDISSRARCIMTCVYAAIDGPKTGPGYLQGRRRKKRKTPNHPNVNVKMKHEERRSSSLFFDQAGCSPRRKRVISGHHHLNASRPVLRLPSAGIHCPSQTNRTRKLQNHGTFRYVHLAVDSMRRAYRSSRSQLLNISTLRFFDDGEHIVALTSTPVTRG